MITIAYTPVTAKLVGADRPTKLLVREALSYMVDGAEYMPRFSAYGRGWDGKSSFFDFNKETFPAGFVYLIYAKLQKAGHVVTLRPALEIPPPLGNERPVVDAFGFDPRYEYQYEVAEKLVKFRQVIARLATGAGKSRCARIAYKRINRPTMFLTTRAILMHQMADAVREMGERVGLMGDDEWSPQPIGFNCAMVQSLAARLERKTDESELHRQLDLRESFENRVVEREKARWKREKRSGNEISTLLGQLRARLERERKPDDILIAEVQQKVREHSVRRSETLEILKKFELVILEEAHEAGGNSYYDILGACRNAHYRLSLTATPFMRESAESNMRLMGCSGPVAITVSEKQLIDCGILARPYFKFVKLENDQPSYKDDDGKTHKLYRSTPWPKCYEIGVTENEERNAKIVEEVKQAVAHGLTAMVLVTYKRHGTLLSAKLTEAGIRTNFIFGDHARDERQAALNALKDGRLDCLIGSSILDVGVDVPAVGMIVLAGAGKAEVAMRQRIGRGLRAKKAGPNVALVVDFEEANNNTLREHAKQRREIVLTTPGFAEGVVSTFDYAKLGFTLVAREAA